MITEILQINRNARTMRFGLFDIGLKPRARLELITTDFFSQIANAHYQRWKSIYDLYRDAAGLPALSTVRRREGVIKLSEPDPEEINHKAKGCGPACKPRHKITFTPQEAASINAEFAANVGPVFSLGIDQHWNALLSDIVGGSELLTQQEIYGRYFLRGATEILRITDYKVIRSWANSPEGRRALRSGLTQPEGMQSLGQMDFIGDLYKNGYKLVKSNVTGFNLESKKLFNELLKQGANKDYIAERLNRKSGTGSLWKWNRLVRTEMATNADRISTEQYKEAGAPKVLFSASQRKRPPGEICEELAKADDYGLGKGIYPIDKAPRITEDTHPNCTCFKAPLFY